MWTISINSATNNGHTASYDESCSSTLASTFSNGKINEEDAGVVSIHDKDDEDKDDDGDDGEKNDDDGSDDDL